MIATLTRLAMIAYAAINKAFIHDVKTSVVVPPDITEHPHWVQFNDYITTYNKNYTVDDYRNRFEIFSDNLVRLNLQNKYHTHNVSVNRWADLTEHEFKEEMGGSCMNLQYKHNGCESYEPSNDVLQNLPNSVDWRKHNVVTLVKNQKKCGSCWSFSATGAMEGAWALATNNLVSLSEQQLLDCSHDYGNNACGGGIMAEAFQYAIQNGMCSEKEDPYLAHDGTCSPCTSVVNITNCYNVKPYNQLHLKAAVARGPVSVAIEADTTTFQLYSGGVLKSASCGNNLDHGVLVVGYGIENGDKYWLVKNSWGTGWGDNGYIKIGRSDSEDDEGICGISSQPVFPTAEISVHDKNMHVCNRWGDVLSV